MEVDLVSAYESDYFEKFYPGYETDRSIHDMNNEKYLKVMEHLSAKGKILEIGSAFGFFLKWAQDHGWEAIGFERSEYASTLGNSIYGANIKHVDFLKESIPDRYDFACLFDTLEHLSDPNSVVEKLSDILKPGGHLFITTGDIHSLLARLLGKRWRLIAPPFHIYYYSPQAISFLLQKHGFSIGSIRHNGKYQGFGSIFQFLFGINKKKFPVLPMYINLGDIMTVIAKKD
jgi:SAM-dependent methyltransferase